MICGFCVLGVGSNKRDVRSTAPLKQIFLGSFKNIHQGGGEKMSDDLFGKAVEIAKTNVICKKLADEIENNPNGPEARINRKALAGVLNAYSKNIDVSTIERCQKLLCSQ